jgi:hypothetical protein
MGEGVSVCEHDDREMASVPRITVGWALYDTAWGLSWSGASERMRSLRRSLPHRGPEILGVRSSWASLQPYGTTEWRHRTYTTVMAIISMKRGKGALSICHDHH